MAQVQVDKDTRRRAVLVLKALLIGLDIPFERWTMCGRLVGDRFQLFVRGAEGRELSVDNALFAVDSLVRMTKGMSEEAFTSLAMNVALNEDK